MNEYAFTIDIYNSQMRRKITAAMKKYNRALLIMPKYFGYEEKIKSEFRMQGISSETIYENVDEISFIYRFVYVYLKKYKASIMEKYYGNKLKNLKQPPDIILVIFRYSLRYNQQHKFRLQTHGIMSVLFHCHLQSHKVPYV